MPNLHRLLIGVLAAVAAVGCFHVVRANYGEERDRLAEYRSEYLDGGSGKWRSAAGREFQHVLRSWGMLSLTAGLFCIPLSIWRFARFPQDRLAMLAPALVSVTVVGWHFAKGTIPAAVGG